MTIMELTLLLNLLVSRAWINIVSLIGLLWLGYNICYNGSGPLASNIVEGGAFGMEINRRVSQTCSFIFWLVLVQKAGVPSVPKGRSGLTLNSYNLRPKARGTVKLRSNRIEDMAIVDPNFLGHPEDLKTSVEGIKMSIDIFQQKCLQKYIKSICYPK